MSHRYASSTNLNAVGTTINDALKLQPEIDDYYVESSIPNGGVQFPLSEAGTHIKVLNHSGNTILAYPQATGTINEAAKGTPIALSAGVSIQFITSNGID
jgi:hypothetical protein